MADQRFAVGARTPSPAISNGTTVTDTWSDAAVKLRLRSSWSCSKPWNDHETMKEQEFDLPLLGVAGLVHHSADVAAGHVPPEGLIFISYRQKARYSVEHLELCLKVGRPLGLSQHVRYVEHRRARNTVPLPIPSGGGCTSGASCMRPSIAESSRSLSSITDILSVKRLIVLLEQLDVWLLLYNGSSLGGVEVIGCCL